MKRFLLLSIVFILIIGSAVAQNVENHELMASDAAAALVDFVVSASDATRKTTDSNTLGGYRYCTQTLITIQGILMDSVNQENTVFLAEDLGAALVHEEESGEFENLYYCTTPILRIDSIGLWGETSVIWRKNYVKGTLTLYKPDGELLGTDIIEAGKRENGSMVFLFVDVDPSTMATGRVGILYDGEESNVLFTKTLGSHYRFRMDVDAWQQGQDFETWDWTLLIPN